MKRYVSSSLPPYNPRKTTYIEHCKDFAAKVGEDLGEFQQAITGSPFLSDCLSPEDVETLDAARLILFKYSEEAGK